MYNLKERYLNECVLSIALHNSLHKLFNQIIISLAGDALMPQTDVEWIIQQFLQENWSMKVSF